MSSSGRARALTLATCVTVGAAHAAAAQSGVPSEPWPATSAPRDSATTRPQLVLGDVIARALAVSPAVAYGAGGVRTVRSLERVAQGAYLPTVLATSAISRTDATGTQSSSGAGGSGVSSNQTFGLSAAVDLFTGGRRGANTALARADLTAANASLISARYSVRLTAQQGFYDEIRAAALTDVARAALAQAEQLLRYTTDMAPAGVVTRSDVLRAQLQLATTQQQLLAATDTLHAVSYALGALVGAAGPVDVKADSASEAITPLVLADSTIMRLAAETSPGVIVAQSLQGADDAAPRVRSILPRSAPAPRIMRRRTPRQPRVARVPAGRSARARAIRCSTAFSVRTSSRVHGSTPTWRG
jgi:outer membrane protein TolC